MLQLGLSDRNMEEVVTGAGVGAGLQCCAAIRESHAANVFIAVFSAR